MYFKTFYYKLEKKTKKHILFAITKLLVTGYIKPSQHEIPQISSHWQSHNQLNSYNDSFKISIRKKFCDLKSSSCFRGKSIFCFDTFTLDLIMNFYYDLFPYFALCICVYIVEMDCYCGLYCVCQTFSQSSTVMNVN